MPDDSALLTALQAGDTTALANLYEAYADRIYRLALGLLRDPMRAEDIVQEAFLALLAHLDRFEGRSKLGTWLYRVAYNASLDHLRRRREALLLSDDAEPDDGSSVPMPQALADWWLTPEQILANAEARAALDAAIQALPENYRAVFILRDVEELSTEETAEAVGISVGAVKVRLHRARLLLREKLAGYFAEHVPSKGGIA